MEAFHMSQRILIVALALTLGTQVGRPQVISRSGLPGMDVAEAHYAGDTKTLEISLSCQSEEPITAWSVEILSHYTDGAVGVGGFGGDYAIQYSRPDGPDPSPESDSGVCFQSQRRRYSHEVPVDKRSATLAQLEIKVKALVFASREAVGDRESIHSIRQMRQRQSDELTELVQDLTAVVSSQNPRPALRALRAEKRRQAIAFSSGRPMETPLALRARSLAEELEGLEAQIDSLNFDAKEVVQLRLAHAEKGLQTISQHLIIQDALQQ